jgi:hypothetical protein
LRLLIPRPARSYRLVGLDKTSPFAKLGAGFLLQFFPCCW